MFGWTNLEIAQIFTVLGFALLSSITVVSCIRVAFGLEPREIRRSLLALGGIAAVFSSVAIVNRLSQSPFMFFDIETAAITSGIIVWLIALFVLVVGWRIR